MYISVYIVNCMINEETFQIQSKYNEHKYLSHQTNNIKYPYVMFDSDVERCKQFRTTNIKFTSSTNPKTETSACNRTYLLVGNTIS